MSFVPGYSWDVFVSYGHGPTCTGFLGEDIDWVSRWSKQLADDLKYQILVRLGIRNPDRVNVWMDPMLPGHHPVTDTLRADVQSSALLVVLMSPYFLDSPWCLKELQWFIEAPVANGRTNSIFVVRAFGTNETLWPKQLRDSAGVVAKGYTFHPPAPHPDDVMEPFGYPRRTDEDKEYHEALGRLAVDIARQLKALAATGDTHSAQQPATTQAVVVRSGRTVFVGLMHDTIEEGPDLRERLSAAGLAVLPPPAEEPVDEASLRAGFREYLDQSDALVLVANQHCGRWPKGQDGGFIGFQLREAGNRNIPCYLWLQLDDLDTVRRPEDRAFLESLTRQAADKNLTIGHADIASFVRHISDSLNSAAAPEPGVEGLAVVCSNLPCDEHIGRPFQDAVMDALGDARSLMRCFNFAEVYGDQISLSELQGCIHDADTVLLLCFDQGWKWAFDLVKELGRMPDLRATDKVKLIVAGPRDRKAGTFDARLFGFKFINGIGLDAHRLRDQLKSEILATRRVEPMGHELKG